MPYVLGNNNKVMNETSYSESEGDFGLDAKVGVTSSLTMDITYNTDFAQVEADEQQVNLDRFSLFFPEKRAFFLENAGLFSANLDITHFFRALSFPADLSNNKKIRFFFCILWFDV